MALISMKYLTDPAGHGRMLTQTHAGMAHFGGAVPGRTCRECVFWQPVPKEPGGAPRYYYAAFSRTLKDRACRQFSRMMNGIRGAGVPHDAEACKYFAECGTPPSIMRPVKPKKPKMTREEKNAARRAARAKKPKKLFRKGH